MDAVIYEVHGKSLYDSSGDGCGDFRGLIKKLNFHQDLGELYLVFFFSNLHCGLTRREKKYTAFGRGVLDFLNPKNPKILAYGRIYDDQILYIVNNLSRFSQQLELDLGQFGRRIPVEPLRNTHFPGI